MFAAFNEMHRQEITLYTDALITRGFVRTRQHRVTDILNHAEDPFLILEDVTVEEFGEHGEPIRADFAQINLDAVLFAVSTTPVEPVPELRTPKTQEQAIVSIPPFRVTGVMHLLPTDGNLRAALSELHGRFLPITEATYWSDHVGEPRQQAVLVAVNHRRAQILAPHKERDPWEGLGGGAAAASATDAGHEHERDAADAHGGWGSAGFDTTALGGAAGPSGGAPDAPAGSSDAPTAPPPAPDPWRDLPPRQ